MMCKDLRTVQELAGHKDHRYDGSPSSSCAQSPPVRQNPPGEIGSPRRRGLQGPKLNLLLRPLRSPATPDGFGDPRTPLRERFRFFLADLAGVDASATFLGRPLRGAGEIEPSEAASRDFAS